MSSITITLLADDDVRMTGTFTTVFKERYLGSMHGWNFDKFVKAWRWGCPGGEAVVARLVSDSLQDGTLQRLQLNKTLQSKSSTFDSSFLSFQKRCREKHRTLSFFESGFANMTEYNAAIAKL